MSRTRVVALVLAIVTGAVLGQLTEVVSRDVVPAEQRSGNRETRVRAFYEGMNQYLADGDDRFLRMLAPNFEDHLALDPVPGSSDTLLERLGVMRQSASSPRFTIEEMHDLGNLVEVRVSTGVPGVIDAAGLTIVTDSRSSALEFVALRRDTIVGRWSLDDRMPLIGHAIETTTSIGTAVALKIGIGSVALDPGHEIELPAETAVGVLMEQGGVTFSDNGSSQRIAGDGGRWVATAGLAHLINLETSSSSFWLAQVSNVLAEPALVLGGIAPETFSSTSIERLSGATQFNLPDDLDRLRVQLVRVVLPPGARILAHRTGFGGQLAVIEGEVEATVHNGVAVHCLPAGRSITIRDRAQVFAGDGVAALQDATVSYIVTGSAPATLLLLTVAPE